MNTAIQRNARVRRRLLLVALLGVLLIVMAVATGRTPATAQQAELHPSIQLLDIDGEPAVETGAPVSTMQTCGSCHDTDFIAAHSGHVDAGLAAVRADAPAALAGDALYGGWDPLTAQTLALDDDRGGTLTTADWLLRYGARHVGGGPAETARDGTPLLGRAADAADPEASVTTADGSRAPWDWRESGVVAMNCFLCHLDNPDNDARTAALAAGAFGWANTATLAQTGVVTETAGGWIVDATTLDADGRIAATTLGIQDPTNANCAQCHGVVHTDLDTPLTTDGCDDDSRMTLLTGQIISPQRLSDSGLNLAGKETLAHAFDVHAERVVGCTDCHYAANNPIYDAADSDAPDHLTFDPRRVDFGAYLERPDHALARSDGENPAEPRCSTCHSLDATHNWLPYKEQHVEAVACESCHVPSLVGPALQAVDWTVVSADGAPQTECRGVDGDPDDTASLISGFAPALLPRVRADGPPTLAPANLVSVWYWAAGDTGRPVAPQLVQQALYDGAELAPSIAAALDGDGRLTAVAAEVVAGRLADLGVYRPEIKGEVRPYAISHGVVTDDWATRECTACHGDASRAAAALPLATGAPGGVLPVPVDAPDVTLLGAVVTSADGTLYFRPDPGAAELYILGHDSVRWVDWFGVLLMLGTLGGITLHGGLRVVAQRRRATVAPALKRVYMYSFYERLWHWLQTLVILLLLFTGLIIHRPEMFGAFSFAYVVQVHNVLSALLVANAALAAFYHLASGEIRQYLPQPRGFFNQAAIQARYYLQGIFSDAEHPFTKTPERKLNPLQQMTYLGILNVLLPLQIITGSLMWGAQYWPDAAARLGGLSFLAPFHTLVAWTFATFIVLHVYLTTTGHTPLANIRAMVLGWDDVEQHAAAAAPGEEVVTG